MDYDGSIAIVRSEERAGTSVISHRQVVTPLAGRGLHVTEEVEVPAELTDLPRVGIVLEVVPGLEEMEWFGRGPHETYPDRRRSGMVGRWRSSVAAQFVPYIRPQEAGGRADVRRRALAGGDGKGLTIRFDAPMQVSATHHRAADLAAATHASDLVPVPETIVHLDVAHRGVGTASCGPDTLPEYRVGPGTYRWGWTLSPQAEP